MKTLLRTSMAMMVLSVCGAVSMGQEVGVSPGETTDGKAEAIDTDRAVYDRLLREINTDRGALSRAYAAGVTEARGNGGQPPAKRRAEILALRERIDRNGVRLMLVAGRHNWPVPEMSEVKPAEGEDAKTKSARDELVPPDAVISDVLSADARKLAAGLRLPTISLAGGESAGKES